MSEAKPKHQADAEPLPGESNGLVPHDDEFRATYPNLARLLWPKYDVYGRPTQEAGFVSVRPVSSYFRVNLSLPTHKRQTTMNTDTLMDIWEQLDKYLASGKAAWELTWKELEQARQRLSKQL